MKQIIQALIAILPSFLRKKSPKEIMEFSELIQRQYSYLLEIIEKSQKNYFSLAEQIRELNDEIILLNKQLKEALLLQCREKSCTSRVS